MAPQASELAEVRGREIHLSRVLNAPPELVFRLWSDPKHVSVWWGPRGFRTTTHVMEFRPGGTWRFLMHGPDGVDYPNRIEYREIVPGKLITYAHAGEEEHDAVQFTVRVEFEKVDAAQTRISMRMTFANEEICREIGEKYGAVEGGRQTLERLGEHVLLEGEQVFSLTREFAAPRELVFRAWTEPERLAKWYAPRCFDTQVRRFEMEPGGVCLFFMRHGETGMEMWGRWIMREVIPPERLRWIHSFSDEQGGLARHPMAPNWPQEMLATVVFEEIDAKRTRMTLSKVAINATEEERAVYRDGFDSMRGGWGATFDALDACLAAQH